MIVGMDEWTIAFTLSSGDDEWRQSEVFAWVVFDTKGWLCGKIPKGGCR